MALWLKLTLTAFGMIALCTVAVITIGSVRWNQSTHYLIQRLQNDPLVTESQVFTFTELEGLPEPVTRYFRLVLQEGQPMIHSVSLIQTGEFRLGRSEKDWKPLQATQHFRTAPPGFVWDARIRMAPLMTVRVRDGYLHGEGSMKAKLFSVISVLDEHSRPELTSGTLQRYLAEAVWFPTALLPSQGVRWTAIDDSTALASLSDSEATVTLQFHFNKKGEIWRIFTPRRYREVQGAYKPTPWAGYFRDYKVRNGVRIPLEGEVEWILPDGNLPYWRGRVVEIEYDPS